MILNRKGLVAQVTLIVIAICEAEEEETGSTGNVHRYSYL